MNSTPFIPFSRPSIGAEETAEVVRTLESGWLTTGPRTEQFEREFAEYVGVPHALAANSGTAALHLALVALGVGPGDEVITSPLTFCSTVNTILQVGATPVLADIGDDLNLDPLAVALRVTRRTRAIIPVHFAGLPCDMDAIWALARRHGIRVVEDAAHAVGTTYRDHLVGAGNGEGHRSDATCFSFYATKNLTTGEGGMVVTDDDAMHERMKILCLHGVERSIRAREDSQDTWQYKVVASGFKYNMSDIQAAIGIHQLRKQEKFISVRARYARIYNEAFSSVPQVQCPPEAGYARHCWHLYVLRLNLEMLAVDRDQFIEELRIRGVGASVHFIPIPLHPFYEQFAFDSCPGALSQYPRLLSLPLYPGMMVGQVERVARTVCEIVALNRSE
jgi:dTDP-4-amino-4,6-dideoxygalactose transaminase